MPALAPAGREAASTLDACACEFGKAPGTHPRKTRERPCADPASEPVPRIPMHVAGADHMPALAPAGREAASTLDACACEFGKAPGTHPRKTRERPCADPAPQPASATHATPYTRRRGNSPRVTNEFYDIGRMDRLQPTTRMQMDYFHTHSAHHATDTHEAPTHAKKAADQNH